MNATVNAAVDVVVAIVTWRAPVLTIDCLTSLVGERAANPDLRVVVVDNDSQDGTADAIAAAIGANGWSDWVELIRAPRNGGFAYGNNLVFRHAAALYPQHRFILLLNPDTVVRSGTVRELRGFMEANPRIGIAGGRCEDPDGTPQICAFRFPGAVSEFSSQLRLGVFDALVRRHLVRMGPFVQPAEVDWVAGALMIVRREVFDTVGLMDESYFLYYEETDFSLRAKRAGWPTWHVPQARAVHYVGQLTGVQAANPRPRRLPAYWFESRRRYFVLNHGLPRALLVDAAVVIGNLFWQLRGLFQRKQAADPPHWLRDLLTRGAWGRRARDLAPRSIR